MIPARIRTLYLSQSLGIGLCLVALFLVANTLYLNGIRDRKAEAVEAVSQGIEEYQLEMNQARKGNASLPSALKQDFRYGALLKSVLDIFETTGKEMVIHKIRLTDVEKIPDFTEERQVFPAPARKKSKEIQKVKELQIAGMVKPSNQPEPYSQLNEAIARIKTQTGCQFSLEKATSQPPESEKKQTDLQPLTFEIKLIPSTQKDCVKQYRRLGGGS